MAASNTRFTQNSLGQSKTPIDSDHGIYRYCEARGRFKMKLPRRKFLYLAASAVPLSSISRIARAQTYPARPVRVIVPYAPGGPTDVFGRLMAQKLSEQLGKQFYVENMGGGGNVFSRPGPVARSESGRPSVDRDDAFRSRARRFMRGGR